MACIMAKPKALCFEDPDDPWLIAKNRFLGDLSDSEKELFNHATMENLYYEASNTERDDRKSKSRSLLKKMRPFVTAIEDFGKALDTYTNIAPLYIAPIWGSIRVLLALAKKHTKFYDKMIETFGRIGDLLPRYREYQRLFDPKKHPRLTQSLSNAYLGIIVLCSQFRGVILEQKKSSLKRIMEPLISDMELEDAVQRFRDHKESVEKELEICHMIEAKEAREIILANKELQERERKAARRSVLLDYLSTIDSSYRHRALRRIRHGETGSWVLRSEEYKSWLQCKDSSVFCCYGIPGCGKSVLASTIIDSLRNSTTKSAVTHYYCDYSDKRTLDPINVLGSITRGLLSRIEISTSIEELIVENYESHKTPAYQNILDIMRAIINESFETVTIVVDGLDEVKEFDRRLIHHSLKVLLDINKPVKILICSRDDDISSISPPQVAKYRLQVQPMSINDDIIAFVQHSVCELLKDNSLVLCDPSLEDDITDALCKGAEGMFLWVKFQLDELCTAESDSEIRYLLEHLPKDLGETYDRLLGRVIGDQRLKLVQRMFSWIICSKRPLSVSELREAIAFTPDDRFWDASKLPNDLKRLIRACGNLILIDEDTSDVHLAHYTVEQYILGTPNPLGPSIHFSLQEANVDVARLCVAYLSFADFETQISTRIDNTAANMAAMETLVTTNSVINPEGSILQKGIWLWERFRRTPTTVPKINYYRHIASKAPPTQGLLEQYRLLGYVIDHWLLHAKYLSSDPGFIGPREYALFRDLVFHKTSPFDILPWSHEASINDSRLQLIIQYGWAIENNHSSLIDLLLGYDTEDILSNQLFEAAKSNYIKLLCFGSTPKILERAIPSFRGSKAEVKTIHISEQLTSDVSIEESPSQWLYTKLINACRQRDHFQVISRLDLATKLDKPVPVTALIDQLLWNERVLKGYFVTEAAIHGNDSIVQYLCQGKLPVLGSRRYDTYDFNVAEISALEGHVKTAKYLYERGIIPSDAHSPYFPEYGIKTLAEAYEAGKESIVGALVLVLEYRTANIKWIDTAVNIFARVLRAATIKGQLSIIRTLVQHGADPDIESGDSLAFNLAIRHRQCHILTALIDIYPIKDAARLTKFARLAASVGYINVLELFINFKKHVEESLFAELLYLAAANGHEGMVRFLLPRGAHNPLTKGGGALLENMALRSAESPAGQRPLWAAAFCGHEKVVKALLESSLDPNFYPDPTLYDAIRMQHWAVSDVLINAGARLDPKSAMTLRSKPENPWGQEDALGSPANDNVMATAVQCGQLAVVKLLLSISPMTADQEMNGKRALVLAIERGFYVIVRELSEGGALSRASKEQRYGALMAAIELSSPSILLYLLRGYRQLFEEDSLAKFREILYSRKPWKAKDLDRCFQAIGMYRG